MLIHSRPGIGKWDEDSLEPDVVGRQFLSQWRDYALHCDRIDAKSLSVYGNKGQDGYKGDLNVETSLGANDGQQTFYLTLINAIIESFFKAGDECNVQHGGGYRNKGCRIGARSGRCSCACACSMQDAMRLKRHLPLRVRDDLHPRKRFGYWYSFYSGFAAEK